MQNLSAQIKARGRLVQNSTAPDNPSVGQQPCIPLHPPASIPHPAAAAAADVALRSRHWQLPSQLQLLLRRLAAVAAAAQAARL